MRVTGTFY
ncbi:hypothetical protein ECPA49_5857, partial [Escherichia coli PA49]